MEVLYIFDLLIRHGVDEAAVTLGYLAGMIQEQYPGGNYRQLRLRFVTEEKPLGTAGGVALAARQWDTPAIGGQKGQSFQEGESFEEGEAFLVISGDAMCDLDLSQAARLHRQSGAAVTIVGVEVDDPREYGLIQVNRDSRVTGFVEKPAWGQATTNLANTGIYIVRPDAMRLVPEGPFDFAKDLFPLLMERGEAIACCKLEGYWCDIGDLGAYLRCQRDMMERRVQCALPAAQDSQGVCLRGGLPPGEYTVVPPVYIGEEVEIASGAEVGPYAVLDDGCSLGERAKVRGSVLLQNVSVSAGASLTGAIVGAGAAVRKNAQLFEGCAVGEKAIIGAGAALQPGVAVWPLKQVESGAVVRGNVKYGNQSAALFDDGGIGGSEGMPLTPEACAALGAAVGSVKSCKKAGVACDGTGAARALMLAVMSGLMSVGSHVWSFGDCFESQLGFFTAFCGLGAGIFVQGGRDPVLRVCGEGGLSLPRYLEREIEAKLRRGEFRRCAGDACKEIADMSSIRMMYCREMMKQAPAGLEGARAHVASPNPQVRAQLEDALNRLGCETGQEAALSLSLNESGTQLTAEENGQTYTDERLLAICCQQELRQGCDIALPYDAPKMLDALAAHEGRSALRYLSSPADQSDGAARRLSAKQLWVRDGLFRAVKLLSALQESGKPLAQLSAELPPFYVEKKSFALPCPPSMLQKLFGEGDARLDPAREGVILRKHGGRVLLTPAKNGRRVHVYAEAVSMEAAREMCGEVEEMLLHRL